MGHGSDSRGPWRRGAWVKWVKSHGSHGSWVKGQKVMNQTEAETHSAEEHAGQGSRVRWVMGQREAEAHGAEYRRPLEFPQRRRLEYSALDQLELAH